MNDLRQFANASITNRMIITGSCQFTSMPVSLHLGLCFGIRRIPRSSDHGISVLEALFRIYNSSVTPSDLPWNTYNYCNAPHVNSQHYPAPEDPTATLEYMNVVIRHHKRTPDNLYPNERPLNPISGWNCDDFIQLDYAAGTAPVYHKAIIPEWHPFASQIWPGTCDAGQLTREGLDDAIKHGQDFWSVYHDKLGFLNTVDPRDIHVRTSTEVRTHQVAGAILYGMDPSTIGRQWPIYTQPQNIDSLVPNYRCPNADAIRAAYQSVRPWTDHLAQYSDLQQRLDATLGTAGLSAWNSWYDHFFDTFTSRTCHGHPLPCNATGACVSQEDASTVFALGDWEYNYVWNSAQNASVYTSLTFGVFFTELLHNFERFRSGKETHKLRFYVGHDGSMIRLAAGLGLGHASNGGTLRWPAMGSEIVMEVWLDTSGGRFVRVLHEGTPVPSLQWVQMGEFIDLLDGVIPEDIYRACTK
ncbi:phosphoglycerate mutase-like protein [Boletus reticuloceps]|uniref:Phosphoglycerate mutase-like protein n=1 Tax=Boletus reticuloceps TaxID=495285 RepID=A0A8I2YJ47_9AGAM|nr:phosphoglycerate mutase-like protein [Boletus reticuloceps]